MKLSTISPRKMKYSVQLTIFVAVVALSQIMKTNTAMNQSPNPRNV